MSVRDEVKEATIRVIAAEGVPAVTIRRVAREVGRSTSAITHYFSDRDQLLREAVTETLTEMQEQIEATLLTADDPLMTFLEWSIEADPHGVWAAIVAASRVGIEPEITERAWVFDQWWSNRLENLLEGRCAEGIDLRDAADAIGVVVEGLVLSVEASSQSTDRRQRLLRLLVEPLLGTKVTDDSQTPT
ncbi:MAG: TetR family transcriptional regulator [Actinobacteria bacterium]|nr:TetR family transcriptional regulator [Actinomycetota bacterium]